MSLNIKKASTEAAIRALAGHTGESLTDAVEGAVREKLARVEDEIARNRPAQTVKELLAAIRPLRHEAAAYRRARGDVRGFEEFMKDFDNESYDENGIPK